HSGAAISVLGNVVWFILGGWFLTLMHVITGLLLMLTIIGIPLGVANMKMAGLALAPFGKEIVPVSSLGPRGVEGQVTAGPSVVSSVPRLEDRPQRRLGTGDEPPPS
ncbi:MAG TPA: YccF domain-containing protein, partial [Acidimicrobiia bacterium]|nr:YccF domain-containing protein [Acidimicrobiia bacterium]